MPESTSNPIVLYDGVCGLCNRAVQFLLKRDRHDRLRFATLQSDFAATLLRRHGLDHQDLDTVYVVLNHGEANESLLAKSDAFLLFTKVIGGVWKIARLGKIIPRPIRNRLYDFVARHRYQVFGKYEACMLPDPRHKHKFIEV
ncbi:MAG TPA: DCC1-like thiol-disulfide oxidoreductase family protein [Pyrinomonadaceae bacterium]|nr:DCC1-like thiol-disulfide oxidoreductase family protein [Pyrinomonadaceae bacterium]